MDELHLPQTDAALVSACAEELAAASTSGADDDAVEAARLRFAWALAHSASMTDVERALELLSSCASRGARKRARQRALTRAQGWRATA